MYLALMSFDRPIGGGCWRPNAGTFAGIGNGRELSGRWVNSGVAQLSAIKHQRVLAHAVTRMHAMAGNCSRKTNTVFVSGCGARNEGAGQQEVNRNSSGANHGRLL